jgi:hypothetical protein
MFPGKKKKNENYFNINVVVQNVYICCAENITISHIHG